jgi:hypothetical protein
MAFIKGMEKRRLTPNGWHSIFSLMRDGEDLARKLGEIRELDNSETQADLLSWLIRRYVQVVETDAVCEHTGLKLNDIWRYFRYTWVNSYKSVPGRSMMILVRDAAVPNHPVIGIASLASSVVQQAARDKWIGWDTGTAVERFRSVERPKRTAQWLVSELDTFIKGVYLKDLLRDGIITRAEIRKPSAEVVAKLQKDSDRVIKHHRLYPNAAKHKSQNGTTRTEWMERAETSLFRSKRAKQLATMLSIRELFLKVKLDPQMAAEDWRKLFESSRFRQAVGQIVRMVRGAGRHQHDGHCRLWRHRALQPAPRWETGLPAAVRSGSDQGVSGALRPADEPHRLLHARRQRETSCGLGPVVHD